MKNALAISLIFLLAGCSYHKTTSVKVVGKNVHYGLARGDIMSLTIDREISINGKKIH